MISFKEIKDLALKGVPEWQYYLGNLFELGDEKNGIPKDRLESIYWYHLAAEREHPGALNKYGMYNYKIGNHKIAYKCFRKSFELNNSFGRYNYCYFLINHPEFIKTNFIPNIVDEFKIFKQKLINIKSEKCFIDKLDNFITSIYLIKLKKS
jgi:TPR repeat protein